ncbi:MAG: transcriptional regulator [Armatimonadota bacterium]|nr:transcriptional regulator [Armatimonadota bacterium]MDR5702484.1 transcriptional regulator [Armatimonadota bacterium]MDR7433582.1 transcriptional regulator [Armatimonadota bacterium]
MQSTRREILTLLKTRGPMTVKELSKSLGITAMGVRQHLATLERDGYVAPGGIRRGQGRPSRMYTITPRGDDLFPRTYQQFAIALLEDLRALEGEAKVMKLLEKRKERLLEEYRERLKGKAGAEMVAELARIRHEEGYLAEWKQVDTNTYLLIEHNCPIRHIADHFQQACHMEQALFAEVLGAEVNRSQHILKGELSCSYTIKFPTARPRRRT